jgi:hypothetical protein
LKIILLKQPNSYKELNIFQAIKKSVPILNAKIHYIVHEATPVNSNLSQINPVHIFIKNAFKIRFHDVLSFTCRSSTCSLHLAFSNHNFPRQIPHECYKHQIQICHSQVTQLNKRQHSNTWICLTPWHMTIIFLSTRSSHILKVEFFGHSIHTSLQDKSPN